MVHMFCQDFCSAAAGYYAAAPLLYQQVGRRGGGGLCAACGYGSGVYTDIDTGNDANANSFPNRNPTDIDHYTYLPAGIMEGDLVRGPDGVKVHREFHGYRRHILTRRCLACGHFRWDNIKSIDRQAMDALRTSDLHRVDSDTRVFSLLSSMKKRTRAETMDEYERRAVCGAQVYGNRCL